MTVRSIIEEDHPLEDLWDIAQRAPLHITKEIREWMDRYIDNYDIQNIYSVEEYKRYKNDKDYWEYQERMIGVQIGKALMDKAVVKSESSDNGCCDGCGKPPIRYIDQYQVVVILPKAKRGKKI